MHRRTKESVNLFLKRICKIRNTQGEIFYTEIPTKFKCGKVKDMVIKMDKSLYGQAESPCL